MQCKMRLLFRSLKRRKRVVMIFITRFQYRNSIFRIMKFFIALKPIMKLKIKGLTYINLLFFTDKMKQNNNRFVQGPSNNHKSVKISLVVIGVALFVTIIINNFILYAQSCSIEQVPR